MSTFRPDALAPVSISDVDGRRLLTMTWVLPSTGERAWQLLVCPDDLARWAPYTADRRLDGVGPVTIIMMDGAEEFTLDAEVMTARPPGDGQRPQYGPSNAVEPVAFEPEPLALLRYSWGADVVEWSLLDDVADRQRTWLTLRHWLSEPTHAAGIAAGWHLCLTAAQALVSGGPMPPIRGRAANSHGWAELNLLYADALGLSPMAAPH